MRLIGARFREAIAQRRRLQTPSRIVIANRHAVVAKPYLLELPACGEGARHDAAIGIDNVRRTTSDIVAIADRRGGTAKILHFMIELADVVIETLHVRAVLPTGRRGHASGIVVHKRIRTAVSSRAGEHAIRVVVPIRRHHTRLIGARQ